MTKEPQGTFLPEGKEPVIERIFQLVDRYPSRSEAARAWGMNVNTLQNYYKRKDIAPTPRKAHLIKIAEQENVSLEWLLTGSEEHTNTKKNKKNTVVAGDKYEHPHYRESDVKVLELLSFLSEPEKNALIEMLMRKGVETILYLLDEDNLLLLQQPDTLKAHMIQEYITGPLREEEATTASTTNKVCARANEGQATSKSLTTTRPRKAG